MIDKVVVISLDRRGDRLEEFRQRPFPSCLPEFEVFSAIDGHSRPIPPKWKPGAWGCWMSHRSVLLNLLRDEVQSALILEDDVVFADDFCDGLRALTQDPWSVLCLGGDITGHPPVHSGDGRFIPFPPPRTHCYAVTAHAMRVLTGRLAVEDFRSIDQAYVRPFTELNAKAPREHWLAYQSDSESDIA